MTHEELLTVAEAARRLKICEATVRRAISDGRIKAGRKGRIIRIPATAIDEFLGLVPEEREAAAPSC